MHAFGLHPLQNHSHRGYEDAFGGIRVCVCILIFNAVRKLWKKAVIDRATILMFAAVLAGALLTELSPVVFVLIAGVVGIVIRMMGVRE